ncbi:MAG: histidine kinase [Treponema sp.]|jgi:sensor histidine kinase YesM|nr:histidine kinase [Treponema sp.]
MPSSLHNRIFLMYSLLFVLVLTIASVIIGVYAADNINRQAAASLDAYSENVGNQVRDKFQQMDRVSTRILFSQNIMDIISEIIVNYKGNQNYFDQNRDKFNVVFQNFLVILGLDISNTIINIYNEKAFISTSEMGVDWRIIRNAAEWGLLADIRDNLKKNPNSPLLAGPHLPYWIGGVNTQAEYFSLSRRLYDLPTGRDLGILQVLKKRSEIESLCGSSDETIRIYLLDADRNIINHYSDDGFIPDAQSILAEYSEGLNSGRGAGGEDYILSFRKIDGSDYSIFVMQRYHSGLVFVYFGTILIAVVSLLIVTVSLNLLVSRYLTRPLDEVINAMQHVTRDNLEMNIDFHSSTEDLKQLQQFYNEMLSRVKEAMNQTLQSRLNEREAYYLALQSQISPHFLYNCISSINSIAYENDVPQIADICELLSNMLRYVMKFDLENSTISEELEYTCNYLKLMQIRYSNEFMFAVHIDEKCGACPIPRLMLQTIAENCFKHAFINTPFPWSININIFSEGDTWTVELIDNGCGIDTKRVERIIGRSQALFDNMLSGIGEMHLGGLGLLNSITRLRLLYNNKIHFSARPLYHGTIVRFGGEMHEGQIYRSDS